MPIGQGKAGIQRRAPHRDGWTATRRRRFLEVLGETCNVSAAAAAVKSTAQSARALKKTDVEFTRLWAEAMQDGAERLREEMVAQQLGQLTGSDNPVMDGPAGGQGSARAPFDPVKAVAALKAFEGFAGDGRRRTTKPATQAEVDQVLMARLEALALILAKREAAAAPPADEAGAGEAQGDDPARQEEAAGGAGGGSGA